MSDVDSMYHVLPDGAGAGSALVDRALPGGVPARGITPLGWQAWEIITSILDDASPGLAEVKWRLRKCLAAHPGSPEQALLAHLMETSEKMNHGTG